MSGPNNRGCRDLFGGSLHMKGITVLDQEANLKVKKATILDGLNVRGATCLSGGLALNKIEIVEDNQFYDLMLVQRANIIHEDFVGEYGEANWDITPAGGNITFSITGNTVTFVSVDLGNGGPTTQTTACITKTFPTQTNVYFTWDFTTYDDDGPSYDPFGYQVNGNFVQLTDDGGNNTQSGLTIVELKPQSEFTFCFNQKSTDQIKGNATTIVSNFKVGGKPKIVGKRFIT